MGDSVSGNVVADSFGALLEAVADAPAVPLDPAALPSDLAAGTRVADRFEIVSLLGSGGMGVVCLARDVTLGREVALKVMRMDRWRGGNRERLMKIFEREARATARLNHPNVVTLHEFGSWNELLYLVLERLHGETLSHRLACGPLPLDEALAIFEQIARGLDHAHAVGIIHRDLKPQNVFLTADGRTKILDFGLASLADQRIDSDDLLGAASAGSTLSRAGTPAYMAPEQWRGEAQDERTDLWAAGVLLHELVTGTLPYRPAELDAVHAPVRVRDHRPDVSAGLEALIEYLLARDPGDRPRRAGEIVPRIAELRDKITRTTVRRRRTIFGAGIAVAVAAASIAAAYVTGRAGQVGDVARDDVDLSGTWAYVPEGRASVFLRRIATGTYSYEYSDAPDGAQPSSEYFLIRGRFTLGRRNGKLLLGGEVIDAPGWGKGQFGFMEFEVLADDRLMMQRSDWGKSPGQYTFHYPSWLMVRVR